MTTETLVRQHSLEVKRNSLAAMDHSGDTKTMWDPSNPDEVEIARTTFAALRKKGYIIYHSKGDGSKGKAMTEFDPSAEKLIAVPPVVGG